MTTTPRTEPMRRRHGIRRLRTNRTAPGGKRRTTTRRLARRIKATSQGDA